MENVQLLKKEPIPKKNYKINLNHVKPLQDFEVFYYNYLKNYANCKELYTFKNKSSRVDFIITSGGSIAGDTSIICEYKNRSKNIEVSKYNYSLGEQEKIDSGLKIAELLNCYFYYWVEYKECILGWHIDPKKIYEKDVLQCPVSLGSRKIIDKQVIKLHYQDASIVVAKKGWKKATVKQLMTHIYLERLKEVERQKGYADPKDIESQINYLKVQLEKL